MGQPRNTCRNYSSHTYYSTAVKGQLDCGMALEDIEVNLRLTAINPLHAQWSVSMYNFFTTDRGQQIINAAWKKAAILRLLDGTTELPPTYPSVSFYKYNLSMITITFDFLYILLLRLIYLDLYVFYMNHCLPKLLNLIQTVTMKNRKSLKLVLAKYQPTETAKISSC